MFKKGILALVATSLVGGNFVFAQGAISFGNLDAVLESQKLEDVSNRYIATVVTYSPERAAVLGLGSANVLDKRTQERNGNFSVALQGIKEALKQVDVSLLSVDRKTDYELLEKAITNDIWMLGLDRVNSDPLYYADAFDNLYALSLEKAPYSRQQIQNLIAKLVSMEQLKNEAKNNLVTVSPYLATLAMEKTYYAYISLDSYVEEIAQPLRDEDLANKLYKAGTFAKANIKELFDFFKAHSQKDAIVDFRLGEAAYKDMLSHRYELTIDLNKLAKETETVVTARRDQLTDALLPFAQVITDDEVMLIEEAYGQATVETPKKAEKAKKKSKKSKEVKELKNAQDFYGVQNKLSLEAYKKDVLGAINAISSGWNKELVGAKILPTNTTTVVAKEMPQYYAYLNSVLLHPIYRTQVVDFFVKLPTGNIQTKEQELAANFNEPSLKLLVAADVLPGKYYEMVAKNKLSSIRKWYSVPTIENAWRVYSQYLAKKAGFILTDIELLYLTWQDYLRALATFVDVKLHTKQFSYADAMDYLMQTHGLSQEDAENIVREVVKNPGKAVSEYEGMNILTSLHDKYQKKLGKKFKEDDFNAKLMRIGSIPQNRLEVEMSHLYKK